MDCSHYSYYISEYVDGRLTLEMTAKVEEHLKTCGQCRKLYEDILGVRDLFRFKKYERPAPDYFETLKSNVKKRILSRHPVTFMDVFFKYITQPSWGMVAVFFLAFLVSLSFNLYMYKSNLNIEGVSVKQVAMPPEPSGSTEQDFEESAGDVVLASRHNSSNFSGNSNPAYYNNGLNGVLTPVYYSQVSSNNGGAFVLRPIPVKNIALRQAKIYQ